MGGAAENCRPEPRGPSTFPQTLCIIIKGRARASAFAETRAAFASPRRPSRIYLNAILPMPRGCISRRGGRRFVPSKKNMRKIERRLSLPNRSNGTRKSAGKLTISRGADGTEAGVGKMIGRIYLVELAVCNLNRSAVCFVMADAARNVPKYVRIGAARLYTLAFGCQLICDQPEIRRRSGSSNSDFPLGS